MRNTLRFATLLAGLALAAGCDGCNEEQAVVRFFLDVNSKAPEPGWTVKYTFVFWNEGPTTARNVELPVPMEQLEPYEHLTHESYVPGSMGINREYHPDTSHESYYFVSKEPLTDAADGDEGTWDPATNTATFRTAELAPDDYVVWIYEAHIAGDADCANRDRMQNWITIRADNSDPYENDINGHITCDAPRLTAVKEADLSEARPGDAITYTIRYHLDETAVEGIGSERFDVRRVRITDRFPADLLEPVSYANDGELRDGGVFWQVDSLANGGSGAVSWTARVKAAVVPGTDLVNVVDILSQNTVVEQDVGDSLTVPVVAP